MKVRFAALLLLLLPIFAVAQTGPRPGDAWNSYTVYTAGNIVTYNGTTYVSLQSNNAVETPSSNPTWWNPIAAAPGSGATAAITGGTIDGAVIGGVTPAAGTLYPGTLNGDATATPSTLTQVTSTNSGSTNGIPSGYGCLVQHVWSSGVSYAASATCFDNNQDWYLYGSPAHPLGSEVFIQKAYLNNGGSFGGMATLSASKALTITGNQTTVSCSTSGQAVFVEPFQGSVNKRVTIHLAACLGTASYTYPVAFVNAPSVYASNNVAASIATSVSTTAVTVTGATTTGSLVLEDY
jgi:hypothetical protein